VDVMLGEQQLAVETHVENAARSLLEAGSDREAPLDLRRQTGGAGLVVSDHAVLNDDLVHDPSAAIIGDRPRPPGSAGGRTARR
jgi:hypothetical protein